MTGTISFDFAPGWLLGLPLMGILSIAILRQHRSGLNVQRILILNALRFLPLLILVFLASRPIWIAREPEASKARSVMLLIDRSESMSLKDREGTRYDLALDFLRERLLPELKSARLATEAMLFDENAELVDGNKLAATPPSGKRTNLGGAIARAVQQAAQPPLAVIALTDGSANENSDNSAALTALADARIPFIGVGFGSDQGVQTLSLRDIQAPSTVSPKTAFSISAQLEMMNTQEMPPFDLLLFRDGELHQKKSVTPGKGSRSWVENFVLSEDKSSTHNYRIQMLPPELPNLKHVNSQASTEVRISDEKEIRVLYVQGALTWDYKFINLALRNDPAIKLTGLTRTAKQSVFNQNVETAGEVLNGFPSSLEELAPYRVLVLGSIRPVDLSPAQQEILARFCAEMGGGVLMIGGPTTFDSSWQNTRLEQLLPVVFSQNSGVQGLDRPFRLVLTDEALQHQVFQIADNHSLTEVWSQLPTFTQYGRVDAAKAGAVVWAVHQTDDGPHGRRILMASQRYGAGLSAVLCIQNFWRWRLAKDSDPGQFDRFWRQLFRFLSEAGRHEVSIHVADQELHPDMDVQVVLERQPNPKSTAETSRRFFARVEDSQRKLLHEETFELEPLRPVDFKFHAEKPDIFNVTVFDSLKVPIATRPIEIRDANVEFQNTARNMETLKQWAAVSDGLALKAEDCSDASKLVHQIKSKIEEVRQGRQMRRPIGINAWMLALVMGSLAGEWILRKNWDLV